MKRSTIIRTAAGVLVVCCVARAAAANPFEAIAALESTTDRNQSDDVRQLIDEARRLTLHGSARRYAREFVKLKPDDEQARRMLRDKKFVDEGSKKLVWLDWFEASMWESYNCVRDVDLGFCLNSDRNQLRNGLIRSRQRGLVPIDEWDRLHSVWSNAHEVDSRFFHIRSTIPLAAVWYVADDLDNLTASYLDYFEIDRLPSRRYVTHLYQTADEAKLAHADADLLTRYGAYYAPQQKILHVAFDSLGALTAVRHEAAHALNRDLADANPPQWFDEGIGVMCQFARPQPDGTFAFGRFPRHGFGTRFVDMVKSGVRERMADVHAVSHVTMSTPHYSKFRSMVAFFMDAEDKQHRMTFIETMFRHKSDAKRLVTLPGVDDAWMKYVRSIEPEQDFPILPAPEDRAQRITKVLEAGSSATLFASRDPSAN